MFAKIILPFCLLLGSLLFITSCEEKSDPSYDSANFSKTYDNFQFNASYFPLDVQQTSDGGYLILSEQQLSDSTLRFPYLLKVDKDGNFVTDSDLKNLGLSDYTHPARQFMNVGDGYYFFCMNALTSQLAQVDANLTTFQATPVTNNLPYPAAASVDGTNGFTLLNYDQENRQFVVSSVDLTGNASKTAKFDIEAANEIEGPIISHFNHTGKQYPFQVGRIPGGLYYFNGVYQYTFSLVFTDLSKDNKTSGVVQGQQYNGGISAVVPLEGNNFSLARFNFGNNFFVPTTALSTSSKTSSTDLGGNTLAELVPDANVKILRATIKDKNVLIYGSDTRSKQIGLFVYDETSGAFLGSRYFGFSNPYEIASIIQTDDGGLAVCGTTYVAGRFPRICLFKISKDELSKNVNLNTSK